MKRALVGAIAALSLLGAVGCSSNTPAPTHTVTKTVSQFTQQERDFLQRVHDNTATPAGVSDRQLVKAGHGVCRLFEQGYTPNDIFNRLSQDIPDMTQEQAHFAGTVVGAAAGAFCPQYVDELGSNA